MGINYIPERKIRANFKPDFPVEINRGHPLTKNLVGAWIFQQGVQSPDLVTGAVPTINGAPTITHGSRGKALVTGTNNFLSYPSGYDVVGSDWTIASAFTQTTDSTGTAVFGDEFNSDNVQYSLGFMQDLANSVGDMRLKVGFYNSVSGWFSATDTVQTPVGTRVAVCGVQKQTAGIELYKDGLLVASGASAATPAKGVANDTFIGKRHDSSGGIFFKGNIEYVYFYSRALSAQEVKILTDFPNIILRPRRKSFWRNLLGGGGSTTPLQLNYAVSQNVNLQKRISEFLLFVFPPLLGVQKRLNLTKIYSVPANSLNFSAIRAIARIFNYATSSFASTQKRILKIIPVLSTIFLALIRRLYVGKLFAAASSLQLQIQSTAQQIAIRLKATLSATMQFKSSVAEYTQVKTLVKLVKHLSSIVRRS